MPLDESGLHADILAGKNTISAVDDLPFVNDDRVDEAILANRTAETAEVVAVHQREHVCDRMNRQAEIWFVIHAVPDIAGQARTRGARGGGRAGW